MTDVQQSLDSDGASDDRSAAAIRRWLLDRCAGIAGVPATAVDAGAPIETFGLGSVQAITLVGDLEEWLGRPVPATLFWDYPTIEAIASAIADGPTHRDARADEH